MKTLIIPFFALFISISVFSQSKRDQIKALKVAFITEKLALSEQEAQKFWPIYNAYDDAYRKIRYERIKKVRKEIKENFESLSDDQALKYLNELAEAEKALVEEQVKLTKKLKDVISPKKIMLLRIAEEDFNRKIFEQFKNRHKSSQENK